MRWSKTSGLAIAGLSVAVAGLAVVGLDARADAGRAAAPVAVAGRATRAAGLDNRNGALIGTSDLNLADARTTAQIADTVQVDSMSARQLAGQRVIYSFSGLSPPASLLSLIRQGEAAGVIFFAANFKNRSQFTRAVSELVTANESPGNPARGYPLLLMTDQEGGLVRRLPGAPVLSEKKIGAKRPVSAAEAAARQAGKGAAANLLSYRLNVNLAPVLDVYRKAGDFDDQYQRSYSMRPGLVAALGADFISAQQADHVAATAKHFPGLGAATASQNTDKVPVTLNLSAQTLRSVDEGPYKSAIAAGVKLVMVSWAKYPALDHKLPAGLSPTIVGGELRGRLGYAGVTITDSIGAGALRSFGSTQNRSLLAAEAGMDLILASGENPNEGVQSMDGLEDGYNGGKLPKPAFRAAVNLILALRASLPV